MKYIKIFLKVVVVLPVMMFAISVFWLTVIFTILGGPDKYMDSCDNIIDWFFDF